MDDPRLDAQAADRPVQGPHWRPAAADGPGVPCPPLRLLLQPGGQVVDCTRPDLVVGRHSLADVRLPLPDVSRRHCRLVCRDGSWQVVDLDSLNGVFVNGEKVREATLHHRDVLRVGGFLLEVDLQSADNTVSLSDEERPADGVLRSIADALPDADPAPPTQGRRAS
jgi:pSer/pThr/pTyr-binding forkhead associated (FHA) protein